MCVSRCLLIPLLTTGWIVPRSPHIPLVYIPLLYTILELNLRSHSVDVLVEINRIGNSFFNIVSVPFLLGGINVIIIKFNFSVNVISRDFLVFES
jgi:hypothetical protein